MGEYKLRLHDVSSACVEPMYGTNVYIVTVVYDMILTSLAFDAELDTWANEGGRNLD